MAKVKSLKWYGKAVTENMRQAQIIGVNQTMAAAATAAKLSHSWQNRTGVLEGGIDIADYAREEADGVRGTWGVQDVVYARIHELGGVILPKNGRFLKIPMPDGSVRFVRKVTMPPRPYLRPAADKEYPKLVTRIRKAAKKAGAPEA